MTVRGTRTERFAAFESAAARGLFVAWLVALPAAMLVVPDARAAGAFEPVSFATPELEARYRSLIDEIRCPKCQNVNLSGSDAPIARDLRVTVARLVKEGRTDAEILTFLQRRYGDFVLYDPPFRPGTAVLWLLPALFLIIAVIVCVRLFRRPTDLAADGAGLSVRDDARLKALLADAEQGAGAPRDA
ncbi:MAG: cytochrome c-type biogenesis protein [Pseudomonadota bacterium]